jgi:hypothetical protein
MLHWIHALECLVKINALRLVCLRNFLSVCVCVCVCVCGTRRLVLGLIRTRI